MNKTAAAPYQGCRDFFVLILLSFIANLPVGQGRAGTWWTRLEALPNPQVFKLGLCLSRKKLS